jgi:hypothetical protein
MRLFDILSGNVYRLNTVKSYAQVYIDYASNFSENDFRFVFFKGIGVACQMFCTEIFEANISSNIFKCSIKNMTNQNAYKLMKLLGTYLLFEYVDKIDAEEFTKRSSISFEELQNSLYACLDFDKDDIQRFSELAYIYEDNKGRFLTYWTMDMLESVLNIEPTASFMVENKDFFELVPYTLAGSYEALTTCLAIFS